MRLEMAERVAHTEYNDNWEVVRHFTGRDPRDDPSANKDFYDAVGLDFLWCTHDGPVPWSERGRVTDMGHATYVEDSSDFRPHQPSPFRDAQDVLAFDAIAEYGAPGHAQLVSFYEQWYQREQSAYDQLVPGGYYKTIVSGAIEAFGWERLLEAAGEDPERFGEQVLGSIFRLSLCHYQAWAETSIEAFMCHDDMVWTEGPIFRPEFYRRYIFPRYRELWRPLREAGKRIIFCSDGRFDMFLDDLAEAGADGFCFEPCNDLVGMVERFGRTHVIMGGADCRTLTFGTEADIERELQWVFGVAKHCPGFVFATGNHLPANIPLSNLLRYFQLVAELSVR
ncbi:MAG: hypothetical protein AMXMBFR61_10570 [Fimbriimonadales bacterium]